jgi:hypothetical protein
MRIDDPVMLQQIQTLERLAESLRRICGFPPLRETPETTAGRGSRWCHVSGCNFGFRSEADFQHHMRNEHHQVYVAGETDMVYLGPSA